MGLPLLAAGHFSLRGIGGSAWLLVLAGVIAVFGYLAMYYGPDSPATTAGSWMVPGRSVGGMFASTSAVEPAGRATASSVRCRRRSSDSPSPSGTVASRRVLAWTSGRSMIASTRLARLPGAMCPGAACSEAPAVPSAPSAVVTSAAATG